ncbi:MAG: UMP kinase [Methanomassiliicoccales archaeon]|nr:UMP kinase [Methanomassiliicoccales archaeon]
MTMDKIVISLGGSVIVPGDNDDVFLKHFAEMIAPLCEQYQIYLVCGGGKIARYYINVGRGLELSEPELDDMGIMVTRMNANLVIHALGSLAVDTVATDILEAHHLSQRGKVVVMGGTVPGHTTDAVAAMLAKEVKAVRIINGTSVDGAYTADPKKDPNAERFSRMTHTQLYALVNVGIHGAGPSNVFDRLGAQIARENQMDIYIVDGRDLDDLKNAIEGRPVKGTVVSD